MRLALAGIGEFEAQVGDLVAQGGLEEDVVPIFRILHYATADLCIFPTRDEPAGIVCTEAMARGTPVVVGASNTRASASRSSRTAPNGAARTSTPAIRARLRPPRSSFTTEREGLARLGRNGRERVLRRFTWEHAAERTQAVYRDAAGHHRTAAQPDRRVPAPIPL